VFCYDIGCCTHSRGPALPSAVAPAGAAPVVLQVAELMAGERGGSATGSREASPASPLRHAAAAVAGGSAGSAAAAGAASVLTDEQAAEQDMEEV
jgi:hypothetical protein